MQVHEPPTDRELLALAGTGDRLAASELYNRYGVLLYALALMVTTRRSDAESAVVEGFRAAATAANEQSHTTLHVLARATFAACPPIAGRAAQWAALLALTLYGAHTYREAAATLGIEPEDAARYLRIDLRGRSL